VPTKIDSSERLFNLTCALLASRNGLTKQEIFSSVQGYKEEFDSRASQDAIERKFDRDKNTLLKSGVNLTTFIPDDLLDDNTETRYRIPSESVTWPADVKFTNRQLALLNLASQMWAKASISSETTRGLVRLRALGETPEDSNLIGIAPKILTKEPSFEPFADAIASGDTVRFSYRKAGTNDVELRSVEPWALQRVADHWLLICYDLDRKAVRNFLLQRVVSSVSLVGKRFTKPIQDQLTDAINRLAELNETQKAVVRVKPNSDAWFHFDVSSSDASKAQDIELHYIDLYLLAEELREYIFDLESIKPQALADAVNEGFEKVVNLHHG
jgi:proteasome accessory factor B